MLPQFFNLTGLVGLALLFLLWVLFGFRNDSRRQRDLNRYLIGFVLLYGSAALTLHNFVYPNKEVYPNTRYHALAFHGYAFQDSISLMDDLNTKQALNDRRSGKLRVIVDSLSRIQLIRERIFEPIYLKRMTALGEADFELLNSVDAHRFQDSFKLYQTVDSTTTKMVFAFKIEPLKNDKYRYIYHYSNRANTLETDTSELQTAINIGLPIQSLLNGKKMPPRDSLDLMGSMLVRSKVGSPLQKTVTRFKDANPLHFFPDASLFQGKKLWIQCDNGKKVALQNPNANLDTLSLDRANVQFYFGLGQDRSKLYVVDSTALGWTLQFGHPLKQPLIQSVEKDTASSPLKIEHFVTSSTREVEAFTPSLDNEAYEGGYYFSQFEDKTNQNHISGKIDYYVDAPSQKFSGNYTDYFANGVRMTYQSNPITVNEPFVFTTLGRNNKWIFSIQDYKSQNPIKIYHLHAFLLLFLFALCCRFVLFSTSDLVFRAELAVYILVFVLLFIRVLLQWRIATFLPVETIAFKEYDFLVNNSWNFFRDTVWATVLFFAAWMGILYYKDRRGEFIQFNNVYLLLSILLLILAFVLGQGISFFERISNLFAPLMVYFAFDFKINQLDNNSLYPNRVYHSRLSAWLPLLPQQLDRWAVGVMNWLNRVPVKFLNALDKLFKRFGKDVISDKYVLRFLLIISVFAYLFVSDAGYAIMFVMFIVLHRIILNLLIRRNTIVLRFPFRRRNLLWLNAYFIYLFAIVAFVGFYYFQNSVIYWLFSESQIWEGQSNFYVSLWLIPILVIVTGFFLQQRFGVLWQTGRRRLPSLSIAGWISLSIVLLTVLPLSLPFGKDLIEDRIVARSSYIKYRAGILDTSVDELMLNNNFGSVATRHIQQAAHNQWLINYYRNRATQLEDNPFGIQPTFTQGASHITQASDLVVPRYLIAEHSEWVVEGLILGFLLLVLIYHLSTKKRFSENHLTLLAIPFLLFITAAFVWLTSTNRFTFFGQDFPLLPIASRITLLLTFTLLLILLASLQANEERPNVLLTTKNYARNSKGILWYLIPLLAALPVFLLPRHSNNANNPEKYDISQVISKVNQQLSQLNQKFLNFQTSDENLATASIDSLLGAFHQLDAAGNITFNDIVEETVTDEEGVFIKSAYDYFIKELTSEEKRNRENFIHLRRRNGREHLTLNRKYFFIESPKPELEKLNWKKDIQAARVPLQSSLVNNRGNSLDKSQVRQDELVANLIPSLGGAGEFKKYQNIHLSVIPRTWTLDNRRYYLLHIDKDGNEVENKAEFRIKNTDFIYSSEGQTDTKPKETVVLHENDIVQFTRSNIANNSEQTETVIDFRLITEGRNVLAKNLWINGRRQLFYPLGKSFSWSYSFANLIQSNRNRANINNLDSVSSKVEEEVRVTIDYKLTQAVADWMVEKTDPLSDELADDLIRFRNKSLQEKRNIANNFALVNDALQYRGMDSLLYRGIVQDINSCLQENAAFPLQEWQLQERLKQCIDEQVNGAFDMSVVAVDGLGRVRLMADYNQQAKIDPNDINQYYEFLADLYTSSDNALERDYFGNINLFKSAVGLGSTFKPFVYASVMSQAKLPWDKLVVDALDAEEIAALKLKNIYAKIPKQELKYFAGRRFPPGVFWTNITQSDFYNTGLTARNYLTKSNNVFHGTVFMLGSHAVKDLRDPNKLFNDILLKPSGKRDSITKEFPRFSFGNGKYAFSKDWPRFDSDFSALAIGLYDNFNLITKNEQSRSQNTYTMRYLPYGIDRFKMDFDQGITNLNEHFYWSFPERSDFLQSDRQVAPIERKGFINPAVGSTPVLVTPLKMAEMGISLFTMNRQFALRLEDHDHTQPYSFFQKASAYSDAELFAHFKELIYDAMHRTITEGTAKGLKPLQQAYEGQYWFYAKTGTTGSSQFDTPEEEIRNKRLLLLIANQAIHEATDPSILSDPSLKLYSIYILVDNINFKDENYNFNRLFGSGWGRVEALLKTIIASETFKAYMKN